MGKLYKEVYLKILNKISYVSKIRKKEEGWQSSLTQICPRFYDIPEKHNGEGLTGVKILYSNPIFPSFQITQAMSDTYLKKIIN